MCPRGAFNLPEGVALAFGMTKAIRPGLLTSGAVSPNGIQTNPVIAAYDLLNEPNPTPSNEPTQGAEKWQVLAQRIVDAIRQVDQNHLIIVERVNWIVAADGTSPLSDWNLPLLASFQVSVNDSNTVYDFHFYDPPEYTLQNEGNTPGDGNYPDENEIQTAKDGTDLAKEQELPGS